MAYVHRTLEQIRRMKPKTDRARINRTTDADIRRHMIEDGQGRESDLTNICSGHSPTNSEEASRNVTI